MNVGTTAPGTAGGVRTSWAVAALQLALTGVVLAAATAGGSVLLAVAENGNAWLETLVLYVALPAGGVIALVLLAAIMLGLDQLRRGVMIGFGAAAVATVALELVRNIGFYEFQSMPGQLPELMGVLIANRIMSGPDLVSNVVGWTDHVWNGAMFGVSLALLVGGVPRGRSHWHGAAIGAAFGLLVGTGFLLSPVSRATGAGIFGSIIGPKYVVTVYLAHLAFGTAMGELIHRFGAGLAPVWELARRLVPSRRHDLANAARLTEMS